MLRLWRGSRPLVALTRGYAALPVNDAAVSRAEQSVSTERIDRKCQEYAYVNSIPKEAFDRTMRFLMDRGISQTKALRTISYNVLLPSYSKELIESKIAWLSDLGLSHDKINNIILRSPNVLGISLKKYEALVDWYISLGVSEGKLPYLFDRFPQGVSHSIKDSLDPKVEFLKGIGCDDSQVARILTSSAHIFSLSIQRLQVNVDYMAELGIPRDQLPAIIANAPQCLALTTTRIQEAVDAMDGMFGKGAGVRALASRVAVYNVDGLRQSFDFLVSTVGFTPERLARQTQLITRNVNTILRPRFEFLKANGVDVLDTVRWINMPNRDFIKKYPSYEAYLTDFKAAQKKAAGSA